MYNDEETASPSITPNFIPALLRYKWYIVLTSIPLLVIATVVVVSLPPVYRSQGSVMVETQKIPTELVQTTVTSAAKDRIEIIRQRVMTREKLLSIIRKYDYFNLNENDPIQTGQVVDSVRRSIMVDVIHSRAGRSQVAIAFTVAFDSRSPYIAHSMANELVTLFLSENVKVRTERASDTTQFLRTEAERVKRELDKIEKSVSNFKLENKDALPEHLSLYNDMRIQLQSRLEGLNNTIRKTSDQLEVLRTQLDMKEPEALVAGLRIDEKPELVQLKERYRKLSLMYKPGHPDLVALKEQITLLESAAKDVPDVEESGDYPITANAPVIKKIRVIEAELKALESERRSIQEEIADLEQRIIKIPVVERGLIDLNRGYQVKLNQYNSITAKIMDAEMAESLEQSLQAEKFSILEPPILPRVPVAPDRMILMAGGVVFSFGLPLFIALGLGFLDKSIRLRSDVEKIFPSYAVVEVANIRDEHQDRKDRKKIRLWFILLMAMFLTVSLVVHYAVMPLDQVAERVLERFGIFIF